MVRALRARREQSADIFRRHVRLDVVNRRQNVSAVPAHNVEHAADLGGDFSRRTLGSKACESMPPQKQIRSPNSLLQPCRIHIRRPHLYRIERVDAQSDEILDVPVHRTTGVVQEFRLRVGANRLEQAFVVRAGSSSGRWRASRWAGPAARCRLRKPRCQPDRPTSAQNAAGQLHQVLVTASIRH